MNKINRIIDDLPNERVRVRVVTWLTDKLTFDLTDISERDVQP